MNYQDIQDRRKEIGKEVAQLWDKKCIGCKLVPVSERHKKNDVCNVCPINAIYAQYAEELDSLVAEFRELKYGEDWDKLRPVDEKSIYYKRVRFD